MGLLTCYTAGSLGLLIGAWFLNLKRGFLVRDIPIWISWVQYLSYILYAWNSLVSIHLKGRIPDCDASGPDSSICQGTMLSDIEFNDIGFDIGILAVMLVVLRSGVYLALRFGAKPK